MPDVRMPSPGHPAINAVFAGVIGLAVACGLQASRWGYTLAHRKQVRANDRAARRARKRDAWDEFGCDVWNWDD